MALGRAGKDFDYPAEGELVPAYRAAPATGRGRGVVVLHEAWGLVDHPRDVCDRLAREGFVAVAPDLFRGAVAGDEEQAEALMSELEIPRVGADLEGAIQALLSDDAVDGSRVGVVGFCMGGALALHAASISPRVGAVVDFYGILPDARIDFERMEAAVLGFFGSADELVSADEVRQLEISLHATGRRCHIETVSGVGHAFMNDSRPDCYDAAAASRAWDRTLAFLRAELA